MGAACTEPATDGTADSQPRRQQGHPASSGMVPAPGLPQPLRAPRHVPLSSAGEHCVLCVCGQMLLHDACVFKCISLGLCDKPRPDLLPVESDVVSGGERVFGQLQQRGFSFCEVGLWLLV